MWKLTSSWVASAEARRRDEAQRASRWLAPDGLSVRVQGWLPSSPQLITWVNKRGEVTKRSLFPFSFIRIIWGKCRKKMSHSLENKSRSVCEEIDHFKRRTNQQLSLNAAFSLFIYRLWQNHHVFTGVQDSKRSLQTSSGRCCSTARTRITRINVGIMSLKHGVPSCWVSCLCAWGRVGFRHTSLLVLARKRFSFFLKTIWFCCHKTAVKMSKQSLKIRGCSSCGGALRWSVRLPPRRGVTLPSCRPVNPLIQADF